MQQLCNIIPEQCVQTVLERMTPGKFWRVVAGGSVLVSHLQAEGRQHGVAVN